MSFSTIYTAYSGSSYIWKEFGTPAKSISRPTNATNSTPSSEPAQDGAQVAGRDTTNTDWQHPGQESGPSITSLGHDPNSDRRKRRRTDQHEPGIANGTPEASEGNSTIVSSVPVYDNVEPTPTTDLHTAELQATGVQAHTAAIVDVATQLPTTNGLAPDVNGTRFSSPEKRYPERQRTLKLNPNGKLLEYPVGKQPEQPDSKRQDNKDNKRGRKAKKSDKKLVVIKYAADDSTRERLGRLIDDICNGRTKPKLQLLAPAPKPNPPPVATNQPPRATHPFFVKKPARKPNTSDPSQIAEDAQQPSSTGKSSSLDSSETSTTTFPTFRPQIPKFPEPIRPLWPPRDFVHVRGVEMDPDPQHQGASGLLNMDQRKAKDAIIRIQDTENVLLSGYGRSMNKQIPQALRIPGRYIASGQTLRKAMASQLSEYSKPKPDMKVPRKALHPAVAHLDLRLATSMSAFDRGMCESCLWSLKYAPDSAEKVLQSGREAHMLRNWLRFLIITAVDTGNIPKDDESAKQKAEEKKRAKKRQKSDKLEGFIVSSEDEASEMGELSDSEEDELAGDVTVSSRRTVIRSGDLAASAKPGTERGRMTNVVLLSGPSGSGKTASVYAVAKELDFEVFEINPGGRRNNRDIVERVGDMTRNHLVHKMNMGEGASTQPSRDASEESSQDDAKQNKLMSFFKSNAMTESKSARKGAEPEVDTKTSRSQKQSLILLEEADILFEEDRQFWSGVMTLIQHSRRPIIITCNDENLIPLHDISFHAILRYRLPPHDLAVDYLLLMAANEGHTLQRSAVSDLYNIAGSNLRKAIMDLNFWCQMGIGSNKSGLDWMLDRWPVGADLDQNGDPLRVLSLNTYQNYMGWFSRDMVLDDTPDSEVEVQEESLHWWQLSIQDSETMNSSDSQSVRAQYPATSKHEQLEKLRYESEYAEMRSALDVLCTSCPVDPKLVGVCPLHSLWCAE